MLLRGRDVINAALTAIQRVRAAGVPCIFLTNGGGTYESTKAQQLSTYMQTPVHTDEVVLSHTPMSALVNKYRDKTVLVTGSVDMADVIRSYGFSRAVCVIAASHANPHMYGNISRSGREWQHPDDTPEHLYTSRCGTMDLRGIEDEIDAVFVCHDGMDWGEELQVCCDALLLGRRRTGKQLPVYFSAPDIVYPAEYRLPRFGQGAFRVALTALYEKVSGDGKDDATCEKLVYTQFGKPSTATYEYAETTLNKLAAAAAGEGATPAPLTAIYGIGDNPDSDIMGANRAGDHWHSVLLDTGLYQPLTSLPDGVVAGDGSAQPQPAHPPTEASTGLSGDRVPSVHVTDVNAAIDHIFAAHGIEG